MQERRNKLVQSGEPISDVLRAESLETLKKSSSGMSTRRINDRLHTKVENCCKQDQPFKSEEPPKHTSPPLQKQLASEQHKDFQVMA